MTRRDKNNLKQCAPGASCPWAPGIGAPTCRLSDRPLHARQEGLHEVICAARLAHPVSEMAGAINLRDVFAGGKKIGREITGRKFTTWDPRETSIYHSNALPAYSR